METNTNKVANEILQIFRSVDVRMKQVKKVCVEGCCHCCHQIIPVHIAEELPITRYVNKHFSTEQVDATKDRLKNWLLYFNTNTPAGRNLDGHDLKQFGQKHAEDRVPCPFLIESKCSIYQVRPLTCRTFSVNDSSALCEADPLRNGDAPGYIIQENAFREIRRASGFFQIRLLPYAIAEFFGVRRGLKGIKSDAYLSLKIIA